VFCPHSPAGSSRWQWLRNVSVGSSGRSTPALDLSTPNDRLSAVPGEIRLHILRHLSIADILTLRLVSRNWNNLIAHCETSIAKNLEDARNVPRYASDLFPRPTDANLRLHYVCALQYRLSTASRLASDIADWAIEHLFLRKTKQERDEFSPRQTLMRRRLTPLLFIVFHFMETYRDRLLAATLDNCSTISQTDGLSRTIELEVMSQYDAKALLQVQQIFPLLGAYIQQNMRGPSYYGPLERLLRGYRSRAPEMHTQGRVLYGGGLQNMVKLIEVKKYEKRVAGVNKSFGELYPSAKPSSRASSATRSISSLVMRSRRNSPDISDNDQADESETRFPRYQLPRTSLSAGPPMPRLREGDAERIFPFLPSLEDIWVHSGLEALRGRRAIRSEHGIKKDGQVLVELIMEEQTTADELIYGLRSPVFRRYRDET